MPSFEEGITQERARCRAVLAAVAPTPNAGAAPIRSEMVRLLHYSIRDGASAEDTQTLAQAIRAKPHVG
jgi:hypothetical protein